MEMVVMVMMVMMVIVVLVFAVLVLAVLVLVFVRVCEGQIVRFDGRRRWFLHGFGGILLFRLAGVL